MKFIAYTPLSQLELDIITTLEGVLQDWCLSLEELHDDYGDCEYIEILVDGVSIQLDCGYWLDMDTIGEN